MRREDFRDDSDFGRSGVGEAEVGQYTGDEACLGEEECTVRLCDDVDAEVSGIVAFDAPRSNPQALSSSMKACVATLL